MCVNKQKKVLILSCSTGEGHNSAAKAIEASLNAKNITCEVKDVLTFKSEKSSNRIAGLYNTLIKKAPTLFGLVYTLGKFYDDLRLPSPVYKANAEYADKLYKYITENGYDRVICTHLFAMQAMTAIRRKFYLSARCYGVMTDYTIHPFIKDSDLDGYFVPNETVAKQFLEKGFSQDKVIITGIPVHPKFNENISKREARAKLSLPSDKKVVAIMTGGAGCGKIVSLCIKLNKAFGENNLFVVLTGRNDRLKAKLDGMFKNNAKLQTVAFTSNVHLYLKAADCVLSKSGGLSSTEVAVANAPLVHLKAIPGLETANLKYFSRNGLSLRANTLRKAVKQTRQILSDNFCEAMLKIQRYYIKANAVERITEKITEGIRSGSSFMGVVHNGRFYCGEYDVLQDRPQAV